MMLRTPGGPSPVNRNPSARLAVALQGLACGAGILLASTAMGADPASSPYRGLWAGQVTLNFVNEVPVPLDKNNNPVAPDPKVATPTFDQAHLRLILHVDGAGQVRLLRDVAVLARTIATDSSTPVNVRSNNFSYQSTLNLREGDLSLVTDERLYGQFPPQPAMRIASAVFDFGDDRATKAVQTVIDAVAASAAAGGDVAAATAAANSAVIQRSDVAVNFGNFLRNDLPAPTVDSIATGGAVSLVRAKAAALLTWSPFFPDPRGSNMVEAIVVAANALAPTNTVGRRKVAQNTAAAHADLDNNYPRFIAGKQFADLIGGGADTAGTAALAQGATAGSIALAVNGNAAVRAARGTATSLDALSAYRDTRSTDAVNLVVDALVLRAASFLGQQGVIAAEISKAAEEAASLALATVVPRYFVPPVGPTTDYNNFIKDPEYLGSPSVAANAAVSAVAKARAQDPFLTPDELEVIASDAATDALRKGTVNAFSKAAVAARRELPLQGEFGAGVGDPRFTYSIKQEGLAALGPAELSGEFFLPSGHPTNPFRHRRHPDHKYGYDLTRRIRLDFDPGPPGSMQRGGYGVSRISGVYREEILGLHKPLGPKKDLGLRVEGRFELNRISLIDALNAR